MSPSRSIMSLSHNIMSTRHIDIPLSDKGMSESDIRMPNSHIGSFPTHNREFGGDIERGKRIKEERSDGFRNALNMKSYFAGSVGLVRARLKNTAMLSLVTLSPGTLSLFCFTEAYTSSAATSVSLPTAV